MIKQVNTTVNHVYTVEVFNGSLEYCNTYRTGKGALIKINLEVDEHGHKEFILSFSSKQDILKNYYIVIFINAVRFFHGVVQKVTNYRIEDGNYIVSGLGLYSCLETVA